MGSRLTWDPQADGARCDLCALRKLRVGQPVPSEFHAGALGSVVAEAPGETEVKYNRPLIGASGKEYTTALTVLSRPRSTFHVMNAIACRPPDNDYAKVLGRLKSLNDAREAEGLFKLPTPMQCCEPRLRADIAQADVIAPGSGKNIIAMGKIALDTLTNKRSSILNAQGIPVTDVAPGRIGHGARIMPVAHPAFVMRKRRWTKMFRVALGRAIRWFETGKIGWVDARVLNKPTPEQLERWLFNMRGGWNGLSNDEEAYNAIEYDIETTVEGGPMWNRMRCVGFGKLHNDLDRNVGVLLVPILSVDGFTRFYSPSDEEAIKHVWRRLFRDPKIEKWGHNSNYFDALVCGEYLAEDNTRRADGAHVTPFTDFVNCRDKIILHRAIESELPHKLAFVGPSCTDIPDAWKDDHTAVTAQSDEVLHKYCGARDVPIQARCLPTLQEGVRMRDQLAIVAKDYKLQDMARGIHRNGIPVYEPARKVWEDKLRAEAGERNEATGEVYGLLKELCDISGISDLNPRSPVQLRKLIFNKWNLAPACDPSGKPILTKSGYPSTSNAAILELRRRGDAQQHEILFIDKLRRYRKKSKLLAVYILPLRPQWHPKDSAQFVADAANAAGEGDATLDSLTVLDDGTIVPTSAVMGVLDGFTLDDLLEDYEQREGGVMAGRVHPNVNVHTPKTGRISMSRPAAQTFPRELRDIFRARPGWMFTIADKDQIELRLAVARAQAKEYLAVFAQKKEKIQKSDGTWEVRGDPHSTSAGQAFGHRFTTLTPDTPDWDKIRDFVKRLVYASLYKALPPTIHRIITSVENLDGALLYPKMGLLEVTELHNNWMKRNPEIVKQWDNDITLYREQSYLRDPIWGRRCDFLDGENENEIVNFPVQAGMSSILWDDTFELLQRIPFEKWGPHSGLVHSEHDKNVIEHPIADAAWVNQQMTECMNDRPVAQFPNMRFTGKPKGCINFRGDAK